MKTSRNNRQLSEVHQNNGFGTKWRTEHRIDQKNEFCRNEANLFWRVNQVLVVVNELFANVERLKKWVKQGVKNEPNLHVKRSETAEK